MVGGFFPPLEDFYKSIRSTCDFICWLKFFKDHCIIVLTPPLSCFGIKGPKNGYYVEVVSSIAKDIINKYSCNVIVTKKNLSTLTFQTFYVGKKKHLAFFSSQLAS